MWNETCFVLAIIIITNAHSHVYSVESTQPANGNIRFGSRNEALVSIATSKQMMNIWADTANIPARSESNAIACACSASRTRSCHFYLCIHISCGHQLIYPFPLLSTERSAVLQFSVQFHFEIIVRRESKWMWWCITLSNNDLHSFIVHFQCY